MTQVAVAGQIFNYEEVGSGRGTPLLVLHGWGRTGNEWVSLSRALASGLKRKVYILDLPGFGGSSLPEVKTIQEYSSLVLAFCQYLGITKTVVIGHSLGGRVGIVLSAKHPRLVEKLILINPAGVKPRSLKRVGLKALAKLFAWIPQSARRKLAGNLMDEDYQNSPALRGLYRAVVGQDLRSYLPQITCQVGIVWGEHDPVLPLSLTTVYRRRLKHRTVRVVWGAGHDPHLTHHDRLQTIVEEMVT